jgi:hypothetical protein
VPIIPQNYFHFRAAASIFDTGQKDAYNTPQSRMAAPIDFCVGYDTISGSVL